MGVNKYNRIHIGERHSMKDGYIVRIIDGGTKKGYCIVSFGNHELEVSYHSLKYKKVKNPYFRSVDNTGYIGIGTHSPTANGIQSKEYSTWHRMISRCYNSLVQDNQPTYKYVTVCEEWHNFQNFAEWFNINYVDGWYLDKDLLSLGKKIYSPNTCIFVPSEINMFLNFHTISNTSGIAGATFCKKTNKYKVFVSISGKSINVGSYDTAYEAKCAYKEAKINEAVKLDKKYPSLGFLKKFMRLEICQ